jgi:hypothetical protein
MELGGQRGWGSDQGYRAPTRLPLVMRGGGLSLWRLEPGLRGVGEQAPVESSGSPAFPPVASAGRRVWGAAGGVEPKWTGRAGVHLPGAVPGPGGRAESGLGHGRPPVLPVLVGVLPETRQLGHLALRVYAQQRWGPRAPRPSSRPASCFLDSHRLSVVSPVRFRPTPPFPPSADPRVPATSLQAPLFPPLPSPPLPVPGLQT